MDDDTAVCLASLIVMCCLIAWIVLRPEREVPMPEPRRPKRLECVPSPVSQDQRCPICGRSVYCDLSCPLPTSTVERQRLRRVLRRGRVGR